MEGPGVANVGNLCYLCGKVMNAGMEKYELISVAHRSRLLFRTEAEFRAAVGVSFETVANNRESERDMDMYCGVLANVASRVVDGSLEENIEAFRASSEAYLSIDWGDRAQLASRRKFCRMMFRLYATAGKRLTGDELFAFNIKDDDERLMREFFPNGPAEAPAVDVCLILLFAFGVIRPFKENSRGRDLTDKDTTEALTRLHGLIQLLKADIPRLGSTEKPLAFDEILNAIESRLSGDPERLWPCTPLWMYSRLTLITRICRSLVLPEGLRKESEQLIAISLDGIWIDDSDGGNSRFWIFPKGSRLTFCYEYDGMTWLLKPYEFRVRLADSPEYWDAFILVPPEENLKYHLHPDTPIDQSQLTTGSIDGQLDPESDEIHRLTFMEDTRPFPAWLTWRTWQRLSPADDRHKRFRTLLSELYDPHHPHSLFLKNTAPELINLVNNLIGRDNSYLYVYDWQPRRFTIREIAPDQFTYEVADPADIPPQSFLDMHVSAAHPLYVIPLEINLENSDNLDDHRRLAEILAAPAYIDEAFIIHSPRTPHPRLCLPAYSQTLPLDPQTLTTLSIRKHPHPPFPTDLI